MGSNLYTGGIFVDGSLKNTPLHRYLHTKPETLPLRDNLPSHLVSFRNPAIMNILASRDIPALDIRWDFALAYVRGRALITYSRQAERSTTLCQIDYIKKKKKKKKTYSQC
ncbi:hypothetical protein TNCV_1473511 [Trichonephila clavipes]|nr:hypothetical protein TNCV_1473511 [Trichonephila clavipes]